MSMLPSPYSTQFRRLSHPFLKFILLFAMLWAASIPTTALAAPAAQGLGTAEDEAVLLAYYESEAVTPDDAEEEGFLGLSFYDDDTFEMSATGLDGTEISRAYGEYEVVDDGVTLTFVGADGEEFDEPTVLAMLWDADDTLLIPGAEDGLFGEEDILLYPVELEASDTGDDTGDDTAGDNRGALEDDAGDDLGEAGEEDLAFDLAGVYVSPVQPYENSDGVVYLLNLLPSGEASLNSDYLDLEAPIYELGTWTDNGDNTVTVEITESLDEEYDDAIFIEFEVGEVGELMLADFSLYPLEILSNREDDQSTNDDLGDDSESELFIYVAEVSLPDTDEPIYIYMFLYSDGSVTMTDADETTTLYGEWTYEDEILSVTLTSDDETTFDEPGELVFEFNDENALVAIDYPVEVFGEEVLIFYPADDDEEVSATEGEFYFYESEALPSTDTDGILISLVLSGEGDALISTDFMDDEEAYLEYGSWTRSEDGNVIVTITGSQDEEYDEPYVFTFVEDEDDLSLTLIEESVEIFGDFELVLHRIE